MPQWRKLHVKATESYDIQDMPDDFTRLLWVMLPLKLCKEGRGIDSASWVKSKVMPMRDDVSCEQVDAALDWFADRGMIERYAVDGRRYFYIPTWHEYQSTERDGDSPYPSPPGWKDAETETEISNSCTQEQVETSSEITQEQVETSSPPDIDLDSDSDSETERETRKPPPSPPSPSEKPSPQRQAAQAMFSALAELCQIDFRACTTEQRSALNQSEKLLRTKLKANPADLQEFGEWWYAFDWRGRGGDDRPPSPPMPHQVRETWGQFVTWRKNGRKAPGNRQSGRIMQKPRAAPADPAQVERDRAALRAHRARQQGAGNG